MALLYDSRFRAFTTAGAPYSGATLTVYEAGTTTLADVFTTAALSTPLTNPVVADANGRFPQIHAAEGALFDLLLKTSGGVTIAAYDDVASLGPEAVSLVRDFGIGGRFEVVGAAGLVSIRAGSQSPDNTGGDLTIEGWAGTQLDRAEIDANLIEVTGKVYTKGQSYLDLEDKDIRANGSLRFPDVLLGSGTFSAQATIDIPLSASHDAYELELIEVNGAVTQVWARFSYDGGATFKSASGDYTNTDIAGASGGSATSTGSPSNGTTGIVLSYTGNLTTASGLYAHIRAHMFITSTSGVASSIMSDAFGPSTYGTRFLGAGYGKTSYGRPTHVRIYPNTSTISGKWRLLAKRGFN